MGISWVLEDGIDCLDDFMHEFVGNVLIKGIGFALHGVFDAVLDGQ